MRLSQAVPLVVAALACGGGSDPVSPPPPPPPPPAAPGTPASIAIQAGDGQEAAPGQPVAIKPLVLVKDAAGRAVAGAPVSFAVVSGGGTLDAASASTGADGTASPGNWRLGSGEGLNRLQASVGSITPVVFSAQARSQVLLADVTIGPAGGTVAYDRAGDPLSGLRLTIPAGAYSQPGRWTIRSLPSPAAAAGTGPRAGPRFSIATDQGLASVPLLLKVPIRVGPDSTPFVVFRSLSSGAADIPPHVAFDSVSVTVASRWFTTEYFATSGLRGLRGGPPSRSAHLEPGTDLAIEPYSGPASSTSMGTVASKFVPGVDDWEFPNYGSYITPNGQGGGHAVSELQYFLHMKSSVGALGLSKRFKTFPPWPGNPLGYRMAALSQLDAKWSGIAQVIQSLPAPADQGGRTFDQAQMDILANAFLFFGAPQLIVATGPGLPPLGLVAYGVTGKVIAGTTVLVVLLADPARPGVPVELPLINGHFFPTSFSEIAGGTPAVYSRFQLVGIGALFDLPALGRFADLAVGTLNAPQFPDYTLEYLDEDLGVWTALSSTTLSVPWQQIRLRARCPTCQVRISGELVGLDVYEPGGTQLASDRTTGSVAFKVQPSDPRVGIHIFGGLNSASGPIWRHLDFRVVTIHASTYYVSPDPAVGNPGTPVTLTVQNLTPASTPTQVQYIWDFADNTGSVTVGTASVQHTWSGQGSFSAKVAVRDVAANRIVGRASVEVRIGLPTPIWKLTLFKLTSSFFPTGPAICEREDPTTKIKTTVTCHEPYGYFTAPIFAEDDGIFRTMQSVPGKALLIYQPVTTTLGSKTYSPGIHLQFDLLAKATSLDPALPFRTLARPQASTTPWSDAVDAFTNTLSATYNAGGVTGEAVNFWIPAGGGHTITQWKIAATVSGTTMSGTISRVESLWEEDLAVDFDWVNGRPLRYNGQIRHTWSFKATRIK